MQFFPTLDELREIGSEYKSAPIATEILSDFLTPVMALKILKNVSEHVYMLESASQDKTYGRYTFLGFDPTL